MNDMQATTILQILKLVMWDKLKGFLKAQKQGKMMESYSDVVWDNSREELKRAQQVKKMVQCLDVMMDVLWEVTDDCDVTLERKFYHH